MEVKRQQFSDWNSPCNFQPVKSNKSRNEKSSYTWVTWVLQSHSVAFVLWEFILDSVCWLAGLIIGNGGGVLAFSHILLKLWASKRLVKPKHVCYWVLWCLLCQGSSFEGLIFSWNSLTEATFKGNQLSPDQRISELDRTLEIIEPKLLPGSQIPLVPSPSYDLSNLFLSYLLW